MIVACIQPYCSLARRVSLDVFRGIAVAAMIIVNHPGSRQHMFPALQHSGWIGYRLADLVFPFFLFIMGAAAAFSVPHQGTLRRASSWHLLRKILRRTVLLIAFGIGLNALPLLIHWIAGTTQPAPDMIRVTGVLQRIGIVSCLLTLAVIYMPQRMLVLAAFLVLVAYWALLTLVPVPHYGAGNLTPEGNLFFYLDRALLSTKLLAFPDRLDPEGLWTTLPACVTALIGYGAGKYMRSRQATSFVSGALAITGGGALGLGHLWSIMLPVSKDLWTGSYVLVSAGWSLLCLAVCHELIDVRHRYGIGFPFRVLGTNSLFLFIGTGLVARLLLNIWTEATPSRRTLWSAIYHALCVPLFGTTATGSFVFSSVYASLWWLVLYLLYRRGIMLKV